MTTSMVCFSCFLSVGGSESWMVAPSTLARLYPLVCRSAKRSTNSPLRSRTSGESTWKRLPSGRPRTLSTMACGDWREMGRLHSGQCGLPILAKSSRR